MGLHYVTLPNGETIAYQKREGGDQTIILVHGNMTSSKHWDVLLESLSPKFTLIAIDMRGFGGSTYHQRITCIKDFSDDLKAFVDTLGLKQFHLIGWSTGGAVGMQFVADYPGDCEKLVLLASASTRGYPFYTSRLARLNRRLLTIRDIERDGKTQAIQTLYDTGNRKGLKSVWDSLIYTHTQPEPARYEEYVDDMLTQRNVADVYHALNHFNISSHSNGLTEGTGQAASIRIPVLVLSGDRDLVVPRHMTEEILADLGSNAQHVLLHNTGHSALIDCPDTVTKVIEDFLE
ncbi:alpha/beta hydrolase [Sporosarcina sp. 179-K 3D1 HS]|uniref:intracellular short-chain-length polyhydroxyalkanoate depolymerase n=1 Tax=Sporosarcina sp. 179-K 3D1 HS TaxID=3232169 RepID=UPI00399F45F4